MNRLRLLLVIATLVAIARTSLGAQSSSLNDNIRPRHGCRLAAQVIQKGHPAPKMEWAYDIIHVCSEAGAALASSWLQTLTGEDLANRGHRSAEVGDGRVMRAALAVATSDVRSSEERRSALDVVTMIYTAGSTISNIWNTPAANRVGLSRYFDFSQVQGTEPVTAADRANVLGALDLLGAQAPVTDISAMAKWLAAELRRSA